jgi:hypothetical protein
LVRRNRLQAWRRTAVVAAVVTLVGATNAHAQDGLLRKLNIDNLEVQSLGIAFGRITPSQVVPANLVALQGDYGNILPNWRVVFGASYWESKLQDEVVQGFADSLQKSLSDPAGHVVVSPVRIYDVTFSADLRYTPQYNGWIKPFGGVGLAAHVVNAEGKLIKGTFVERSLDDIAAGLYATGGITLQVLPHFGIEASARGDLLSGFRSTQVRVGAAYILGVRRDKAAAPGPDGGSAMRERSNGR